MSVQTSKEKLTGTKVSNFDFGRGAIVDESENKPLYDEISGDELVIPTGWLVVLVDGDGTEARLGLGNKVWSECLVIGTGDAPEPVVPTGVTPGAPGEFTPSGADVPADLSELSGLGALGQTDAWEEGDYVVLGDESHAYWDGADWQSGEAPAA